MLIMGVLINLSEIVVLKIFLSGFVLIILNSVLEMLFDKSDNKFLAFIDKCAGIFLLGLMKFMSISLVIVAIILIFSVFMIITVLINSFIFRGIITDKASAYLAAVATLVVISYKGTKVLDIYIKIFGKTKGILSGYYNYRGIEYFTKIDIRKLAYEISITLYMLTRVINIASIDMFNYEIISDLIAEAFLTFVAIDCYICTFRKEIIEDNKQMNEVIKEKYLVKYKEEYDKYIESIVK